MTDLNNLKNEISLLDFKNMRRTKYISNIIRKIIISNLGTKDKPLTFNIRPNLCPTDLEIGHIRNRAIVKSYRDIDTGLIVSDNLDVNGQPQTKSVHDKFRNMIVKIVREEFERKLDALKLEYKKDPDAYSAKYKPLDIIAGQGYEQLDDKWNIYKQVDSWLRVMSPSASIAVNEQLAYDDTVIADEYVTFKTPYTNPMKYKLTQEDVDLVENFLSAFLTPHAISVLSWYFGATVCNVPIYDDTISKALIVCSTRGGCGKTTLIDALSQALFTKYGYDVKPDFDSMFTKDNRFARSGLKTTRLTYYNEADFNAKDPDGKHDFSGLATTEIKSLLSDGRITRERKFEEANVGKLSGMHVILTNSIPEINSKRSDLLRRFIAISVKSSTMAEKGRLLGLKQSQDLYAFVKDNVQAFASFFAQYYLQDKTRYTIANYSQKELIADNTELAKTASATEKEYTKTLHKLMSQNVIDGLKHVADDTDVDITLLLNDINKVTDGETIKGIRIVDNVLFLNSTKSFFDTYNISVMRDYLRDNFEPVKKFGLRMFKLGPVK